MAESGRTGTGDSKSERIRHVRVQRGLKQDDIARALTAREGFVVSKQDVSRYETGDLRIPAVVMPGLATQLGVSTDALLTDGTTIGESGGGGSPGGDRRLASIIKAWTGLTPAQQGAICRLVDVMLVPDPGGPPDGQEAEA